MKFHSVTRRMLFMPVQTILYIALGVFCLVPSTECTVFIKLGGQDLTVTQGNHVLLYCRAPEINTIKVLLGKKGNVHLSLSDTIWSRFMFMWSGINRGFGLIPNSRRETQCEYLVKFIRSIAGTNSVTVLSPPDASSPMCTLDTPISHVQVGQTIRLTCTSRGGNPPAELQWFTETGSLAHITTRQSTITHVLHADDNGVTYTCTAHSRAMDIPRSCTLQPLRIQPTVQVLPVTNFVQVEESAIFKCKGDGVPYIERYIWYFGDQLITSNTGRISVRSQGRELHIDEVFWRDHNIVVRCEVSIPNRLKANATGVIRVVYDLEPTALHVQPGNRDTDILIPPMRTDRPIEKHSMSNIMVLIGLGIGGLLFGVGAIMTYIVYVKLLSESKNNKIKISRYKGGRYGGARRRPYRCQSTAPSAVSIISHSDNMDQSHSYTHQVVNEDSTFNALSCRLERIPSEAYKKDRNNINMTVINEEDSLSYEPIDNLDDGHNDEYYEFSGEHRQPIDYDDISLHSDQSAETEADRDTYYEALRPESDILNDIDINAIIDAAMQNSYLTRNCQIFNINTENWAL